MTSFPTISVLARPSHLGIGSRLTRGRLRHSRLLITTHQSPSHLQLRRSFFSPVLPNAIRFVAFFTPHFLKSSLFFSSPHIIHRESKQNFSSEKKMAYSYNPISEVGQPKYLGYFKKGWLPISPWHDIPLFAEPEKKIANFVLEIPKGTQPKLEINKDIPLNPIKQDIKNGKLRNVAIPYPFNYGAFPQTWENPGYVHPATNAKGDNDPVDVCEIGSRIGQTGEVRQVKILGTYAMIDEGETDWKVIVIDVNDPAASKYNDISDVEPAKLKEVFEFLRDYKIPDGKPPNKFGFDDKPQNREFALKVIEETHNDWKKLVNGEVDKKSISIKSISCGKEKLSSDEARAIFDKAKM
jgi:inorganic pyrophosphatase